MKQDYFVYKGKKYYSGTILIFKSGCTRPYGETEYEVVFVAYLPDSNRYLITTPGNTACSSYPQNVFYAYLLKVTDKVDSRYANQITNTAFKNKNAKHSFADELNIDSLFLAWIWYIFIMAISIIFNGFWLIWIVASYIFFDYRKEKLRKAGYKQ